MAVSCHHAIRSNIESNFMLSSISIIIPAYQAADYLTATLKSCLSQTLAPAEVIVVDDGSTDGTGAVAEEFGPAVRVESVKNGGVARARNIGARLARGECLVFLDADDTLVPSALERLHAILEKQNCGAVYGMVTERAEPPAKPRLNGFDFAAGRPPHPAQRNFWRSAVITPGSAIVRAELHTRVGGFVTGYEPLEDRDYWIKCGLLEPMGFCDHVVLDKAWHPSSHGSQHAKRIYRGQRAQRALRTWCQQQGVDGGWIPSDAEIVKRALDEAVWRRTGNILRPLRKEAKSLGICHWRSALWALLPQPSVPDWLAEEPRILDQ